MEKDAGEEFFTGSNKQGFDYYSGHFYLKNISQNVHSVALGDFQVYFGQGLTIWGGFGKDFREHPTASSPCSAAS